MAHDDEKAVEGILGVRQGTLVTTVICCDTSFLYSLYGNDVNSGNALELTKRLTQPITVSVFNEFEFENAVRGSIFRRTNNALRVASIVSNYANDKRMGKIDLVNCDLSEVLKQAKGLSVAYSESGGHRAYDILHVAAAMRMGAMEFISFDGNQRKLAKAVGLKVRPV